MSARTCGSTSNSFKRSCAFGHDGCVLEVGRTGVLFGVAGAVLGVKKTESPDTGAYSYLKLMEAIACAEAGCSDRQLELLWPLLFMD